MVVSESATLWTITCQAPLSMGFSRREYRNGLPCPPSGDLPDPGIEPASPRLLHCQVGSTTEPPVVLKFESASAAPGGLPSPLPASSLVGFHWGQRMCVLNNFPGDMRPLVLGPYCIYFEVLPINISFCLKNLCCSSFSISL